MCKNCTYINGVSVLYKEKERMTLQSLGAIITISNTFVKGWLFMFTKKPSKKEVYK